MAIALKKGKMSFGLGIDKLLVMFSFFCLEGVCVGGRALSRISASREQEGTRLMRGEAFRSSNTFNVRSFGAQADGRTDDGQAFTAAWKEACKSTGRVSLVTPKGTYLIGPVKFDGPCENVSFVTVQMEGYLKVSIDLIKYESGGGWVEFRWLNGLSLKGGGTFDGQGAQAWPYNNCLKDSNLVKFMGVNNTLVEGLTSINSKFFHMALVECHNFRGTKIEITAPEDSPNTDGNHVERSSRVFLSRSHIGTGHDCISIGQGNSHITITSIHCGPGHGISVGSLGKYRNERDVSELVVRNCYMNGTTNGIRIKTWPNSPGSSAAKNMTFANIFMNNVSNPIIIDQSYCPSSSCSSKAPSRVRLSDIHFKNIRGTSSSEVVVNLECSKGIPCQNIYLEDVHLDPHRRVNAPLPFAAMFGLNLLAPKFHHHVPSCSHCH